MKSYLDSPQYRAMMQQALSPGQATGPGGGMANAAQQMAAAFMANRMEQKGQAREGDYNKALAGALQLQPTDYTGVTPRIGAAGPNDSVQSRQAAGAYDNQIPEVPLLAKLLQTGNADVTADYAPLAAKQQMEAQAPLSTTDKAKLQQELLMQKNQQTFTGGQGDLNRAADTAALTSRQQFEGQQGGLNRGATASNQAARLAAEAQQAGLNRQNTLDVAGLRNTQRQPTADQSAAIGYANRLAAANKIFDDPALTDAGMSAWQSGLSGVPIVGNSLTSSKYQQFDQAQREFINAQLRRESGAAIAESEFANARKQYFPVYGDKPEVIAQKKAARDLAAQNMGRAAGPTYQAQGSSQWMDAGNGVRIRPLP